MKKIFLFLFIASSFVVDAQVYQAQSIYGVQYKRLKVDSTLHIPTFCGTPTLAASVIGNQSAIAFDSCNNKLYYYNPKDSTWSDITGTIAGMDTAFFSSSPTADTIIGVKGNNRFVIGINYTSDGLISGGIVTWNSGLTFDATAAVYRKNAVIYNSAAGSITLDAADPTYNRIDLIVLDTTGSIVKVTGTPSANPSVPQIDPTYGIILTQVQVNAGATTPTGVSTSVVYDENTEFTTSAVNTTVNYDNTVNPFHLTKSADVTAASSGGYLQFVSPTVLNSTNYSAIKFYIRLKTALAKRTSISVIFYNGTINVSNGIVLSSTNGFDPSITGTYQNISIPIADFNFSPSSFDRVRIVFNGNTFSSFYVDYIQLQSGVVNSGGSQDLNFVRTVFIRNDSLFQLLNGANQFITKIATPESVHDSIAAIPKDTTKLQSPLYWDAIDSTIKFKSDSLYVPLKYAGAAKDTTNYTDSTLIDKKYLNNRLAGFTPGGGGTSTIDTTLTATAGQTNFVFASLPTRYIVMFNGIPFTNYTTTGGTTIIVGFTDVAAGDKIRLYQTQ